MHQELTYKLAQCCSPEAGEGIIGYFKEDGVVTVHRSDCASVQHLRLERLLEVTWAEIHAVETPSDTATEDPTFDQLDEVDYLILKHHQEFGLDYSIVVSEMLGLPLEETQKTPSKIAGIGRLEACGKTDDSIPQEYCKGEMDQAPQPYLLRIDAQGRSVGPFV